jgi:Putative restriction endonuclease
MDALHEIRRAIERLSLGERRELEVWIREVATVQDGVSEPHSSYGAAQKARLLSVEEYLKFEEMSTTKHEYIGGELFAMTGATTRHNVICLNVAFALAAHVRGGSCRAYVEAVKVRLTVKGEEIFYYPDVSVACGPQDLDKVFVTDPKLIVEVLSPSTERTDRGEKALGGRAESRQTLSFEFIERQSLLCDAGVRAGFCLVRGATVRALAFVAHEWPTAESDVVDMPR